jgi:heat shock protein HslJ
MLVMVAAILATASASPALAHGEKLEGSEWGVVGDEGEGARYISFAGSGQLFGFGGCNRFTGTYEQHDQHLKIMPLAATRMACAPEVMQKERDFLGLLEKAAGVKVDHTLLLLLDEAGGDLKVLTRRSTGGESGNEE